MSTSKSINFPTLTRRKSLQIGAAATATGLLASQELATPVQAKDLPAGPRTEQIGRAHV